MRKFLVTWRSDLQSGVPYVIWAALTLVVSFSGPFGTYRLLELPLRATFWGLILALAILAGTAVRALVFGVWNLQSFRYGSTTVALILALIFPVIVHAVLWIPIFQVGFPVPDWTEIGVFTGLCSLAVGAYRHALRRKEMDLPEQGAKTARFEATQAFPEQPTVRLFDRLPEQDGTKLISISVRDHYVDVRTTKGTTSLLMRLSDAIGETTGVDGAQIHRSHWVAWDAVVSVERAAAKMMLTLIDGSRLPVSKTYRDLVDVRGFGKA
ncbi:LytTR family transcriptional regulator DNA-binding domain-containing protein [Thioclava sp. FR2]|uniref:LytTR family DNA-binding domain-containing protein n=1 Tax=Thioclava sp. FR2 TaxID=3445780 RepID=UPI003EBBE4AB